MLGLAGCTSPSDVSVEKSKSISSQSNASKQNTLAQPLKTALPLKLYQISKNKLSDSEYQTYNLRGNNKPNGMIYRLRVSKPVDIPDFLDKEAYEIVDAVDNGWLVLDRKISTVIYYDKKGTQVWALKLADLVKEKRMEVQDIRFEDNILYFNAACIGYSSSEKGKCSSLYAIDTLTQKVLWRTPYLVSNNIFIIEGELIISGYGFTSEPDYIFLIDKNSGKIIYKQKIDSGHNYLEVHGTKLYLITYKSIYVFDMVK